QALAPINIQNSFKEAGYLREIRSNGRVYSTMNDAVFGDIIDAIEADETLMRFQGTRQTRFRKTNGLASQMNNNMKKQSVQDSSYD
ncbi:MAG: hypothetical protein EZS28_020121, partial [Streblomastix strix]